MDGEKRKRNYLPDILKKLKMGQEDFYRYIDKQS